MHTEPHHITKRSLDPAQMAGLAVEVGVAATILILVAIMVVFHCRGWMDHVLRTDTKIHRMKPVLTYFSVVQVLPTPRNTQRTKGDWSVGAQVGAGLCVGVGGALLVAMCVWCVRTRMLRSDFGR